MTSGFGTAADCTVLLEHPLIDEEHPVADEPTTTPHSGSRWEPPTNELPHAVEPVPPAAPAAPAAPRSRRLRRRGALLGAAVGLAALGGVGGYAIGQAAAGAGDSAVVQDGTSDYGTTTDDGFPGPRGDGDGRGVPPDSGTTDDGTDDSDPA